LSAEIINRKITGRPILPLDEKGLKEFEQKQKVKRADKETNSKPAFTGAQPTSIFKQNVLFSKSELHNILKITAKIDAKLANKYTELIEKRFTGDLKGKKLDEIFSNKNINEVSLGEKENLLGKSLRCLLYPIIQPIRFAKKLANKGKQEVDELVEVRNYLKTIKKLINTKYKDKEVLNDKNNFNKIRSDVMNSAFASFRSTEANYNAANYSIIKRVFSYSIFTTFIAWDAYNVTMMHSKGDKKKALVQAKQRVIQEVARFFISIYTASATLPLVGECFNKSLPNLFGITLLTSATNGTLTRKILGIPITPKDKTALDKFDKDNSKSSFHKQINKLTGKDKD